MSGQQLLRVPNSGEGKKTKTVRTPFWFFMMEKKQQWEQEGRWDGRGGTDALVKAALPHWTELKAGPPHLMEKYIELHREWKAERRSDLENVYDTMGRSLADIHREGVRQNRMVANMEREIEDTVASLGDPSVAEASFFVAHFNYLCRTDRNFYPPCEAAVVEFSLQRGVIRCWQEFLSPLDSIPLGHKYKCQQHARVTHFLTQEFEHYQSDYRSVMASLIKVGGCQWRMPSLLF